MNKVFNFLNYYTKYSSTGDCKVPLPKQHYYCFGDIFHRSDIVHNNTYTIHLFKYGKPVIVEKKNNAILTDRKGIVAHLRALKKVVNFNYRLAEKKDIFILKLHVKAHLFYHKYILTWVRYLYEFPFNVYLLDVARLTREPEFKWVSAINLFNIVGATCKYYGYGVNIHAIGSTSTFKKLKTNKELKKALNKYAIDGKQNSLNYIFAYIERDTRDNSPFKSITDVMQIVDLDFWKSDKDYQERLDYYKYNYKILKSNIY
jgi:hypothetical protein